MDLESRKNIERDCPVCGKKFKNIFSMSAHKAHCLGLNSTKQFEGRRNSQRGKIKNDESQVLIENSEFDTAYAKKMILKLGYKDWRCESCNIIDWLGKEIVLELDHVNGNSNDHRLENLRLLCPNCHSQTSTWRGRNKNTGKIKVSDEELLKALKSLKNIRSALVSVGLSPKGGNYARCHKILFKEKNHHN